MPVIPPKNKKEFSWGRFSKTLSFWILIILIPVVLIQLSGNKTEASKQVTYTQYRDELAHDNIAKVTITAGKIINGVFRQRVNIGGQDTKNFMVRLPVENSEAEVAALNERSVSIDAKDAGVSVTAWVLNFVPWLLLIGFYLFLFKQMQAGGAKAFSFGKSKAKLLTGDTPKITFADVAGADEAKQELQEIIEFLRDPQKFTKLGGRLPKGALLVGPPGTGKTLLAKAVAGEAARPFFSMSGSDFVEMFVGVGASRVRDLFEQGKKNAPCIIFIDEIDAVGRHRGAGLGGGHDEREQTLNQLLVEMDGFESNEGVILVAATNRPDVLDPALLRPGRFDRRVVVGRPDVKGREQILKVHTKKVPLADDVDLTVVARGTPGFAGADLANLVNEAALVAARQNRKVVTQFDFELAKDKVMMGVERKSLIISDEEKKNTAYHEAGHALVAALTPYADPLHKVTIIPRGMALGLTMQLPLDDKHCYHKEYLEAQLGILMGGRIAEEVFMHHITTGAGNDIERATEMARKMVCEWGMSELGPLSFGKREEQIFLGREIAQHRDYSEATAIRIDEQVKKLVQEGYNRARAIIEDKAEALERIALALLEREVLDGSEVHQLIAGETLRAFEKPRSVPPEDGPSQQILKPDPGRRMPGILPEGGPQPA
jgi:cell division protease FtsH